MPTVSLFVPVVTFLLVLGTAVWAALGAESMLGAAATIAAGFFCGIIAAAFASDVLGIKEGIPGVH